MSLANKTAFITGSSRGIGLAIAKRFARAGAKVVIIGKTAEPNDKLPGTIFTAAAEVEAAGGQALPVACDIRSEDAVEAAVAAAVARFGGIDIVINNASALYPRPTVATPMKRWDLMHEVNVRGTFLTTQKCLPYLAKAASPHILALSPPLDIREKWFSPHVAYTSSKFGMSLCILGWAGEFRGTIAANALWPRTAIATAAVANLLAGPEALALCRTPEILADAAYAIVTKPVDFTGHFLIDDSFLSSEGVTDFDAYRVRPGAGPLLPDFFVPDEPAAPEGVELAEGVVGH